MPETDDIMTVHVDADLSAFRSDMEEATRLAKSFGSALSSAFEGAALKGQSLSDVLKDILKRLSSSALSAALKPWSRGCRRRSARRFRASCRSRRAAR